MSQELTQSGKPALDVIFKEKVFGDGNPIQFDLEDQKEATFRMTLKNNTKDDEITKLLIQTNLISSGYDIIQKPKTIQPNSQADVIIKINIEPIIQKFDNSNGKMEKPEISFAYTRKRKLFF